MHGALGRTGPKVQPCLGPHLCLQSCPGAFPACPGILWRGCDTRSVTWAQVWNGLSTMLFNDLKSQGDKVSERLSLVTSVFVHGFCPSRRDKMASMGGYRLGEIQGVLLGHWPAFGSFSRWNVALFEKVVDDGQVSTYSSRLFLPLSLPPPAPFSQPLLSLSIHNSLSAPIFDTSFRLSQRNDFPGPKVFSLILPLSFI